MNEIKVELTLNERQLEYIIDGLFCAKEISNKNRSGHASFINPIIKMFDKERRRLWAQKNVSGIYEKASKAVGAGQ